MPGPAPMMSFENMLTQMLAASRDATVVLRRDGRIVFASKAVHQFVGDRDVTGEHMSILLPLRFRRPFARYIAECFADRTKPLIGHEHPFYFVTPGGERQVECAVNTFSVEEDTFAVVNVREVPDRAPVEESLSALNRLERRLESALLNTEILITHAPAAIAVLDRDMRYMLASKRWLDEFGLSRDFVGKSHYDLFPDIPERWREAHRQCLSGQIVASDDDYFDRADGTREYLRWEIVPWRFPGGEIGGMTIFSEFTTQRKLAEMAALNAYNSLERLVEERTRDLAAARDAAIRTEALKTRLLAAASHDLRQPLHALSLMLEAIKRRQTQDEAREICAKAEKVIDRAGDTLGLLLDAARIEDGALRPQIALLSCQALFNELADAHRGAAETKGLTFEVMPCDHQIETDAQLFERILDNLVGNAIKYTDQGGVRVSCAFDADELIVQVSDTGRGIKPEALHAIFDPYVQLADGSGARSGFGLGLTICRTLANALGCRLDVRSVVGEGSTFSVTLPVKATRAGDREGVRQQFPERGEVVIAAGIDEAAGVR